MNQILSLELDGDKGKKGQADIKKVIIFFAIVLLVFGIILITKSVISIIKGEPEENIIASNNLKPEVNVEQDGEKLNIQISHTIELSKVQYKWNDESEEEIDLEGETEYEESIDIPVGNNKFYIKVIDSQGHFTEFEEDYTVSCCLYSKLNTYLDYTMKTLKQFIKESLIKEENEEFSIEVDGYEFKIKSVENRMIKSVLVTKLPEKQEKEDIGQARDKGTENRQE